MFAWVKNRRNSTSASLRADRPTSASLNSSNGCSTIPSSCGGSTAEAICRLEFFPATVDTDWLFIPNLTAVKLMSRAIDQEDKSNFGESTAFEQSAIKVLRAELEKYSPRSQTTVNVHPHGTASPRRIFAGFN